MKNLSLQEQLLKAGLTNDNKVKQVRTEKRKQAKRKKSNKEVIVNEAQQQAQDVKLRQQEKDRLLNQQRNEGASKKQIVHQILQLIECNKLPKDGEDALAYNFTDDKKVKTIYITQDIRTKIISGRLAVVKSRSNYEVVAAAVANKIKQRDESIIIVMFDQSEDDIEDDEYQGYEIPDDLMW